MTLSWTKYCRCDASIFKPEAATIDFLSDWAAAGTMDALAAVLSYITWKVLIIITDGK